MFLGAASMIGTTGAGYSGNIPHEFDVLTYTNEDLKEVADIGYTVHNIVISDPKVYSEEMIKEIRYRFEKNSVLIGNSRGTYGGGLVSSDENTRKNTINFVEQMCGLSAKLGCPSTYLRPGSLNENGAWLPHPENHTDKVFDRLVDSTKQICKVAESEGMLLILEGGYVSPVYSAKRVKDFFEAVGSKNLKFNQDPVNFLSSLEEAYNTRDFLEEFFTLLGDYTISADLKDFKVIDSLLFQLEEEYLGHGMMDQVYFLKRMQEICPNAQILVEHIPREKFKPSYTEVMKFSKEAGIQWEKVN